MKFKKAKLMLGLGFVIAAAGLQGCDSNADLASSFDDIIAAVQDKAQMQDLKVVNININLLKKATLPEGAIVEITLEDISIADVPAEIIATEKAKVEGVAPYQLILKYDTAKLDQAHRYALRADIKNNDEVLYKAIANINPLLISSDLVFDIQLEQVVSSTM